MSDIQFDNGLRYQSTVKKTISVFGLRGGVGKTMLSVNLALALSQQAQEKVALVDMALDTMHCSLFLNLRPKNYLTNLVEWPDNSITQEETEHLLCAHSSGLMLLPAAENPQEAELLTVQMLDIVWGHLEKTFSYLVIDTGSHFDDLTLTAMDRSDIILLVLSPELASLKSITDTLSVFKEIGIPQSKVLAVANWVFPPNPLLLKRIQPAIKVDLAGEIPYEPVGVGKSLNTGQPLLFDSPHLPAVAAIQALAQKISAYNTD